MKQAVIRSRNGKSRNRDRSLPDSPQAFAEILGNARREAENWEQHSNDSRAEQFRLDRENKDAETAFSQALKEVQTLQRQPSNIPLDMLEMRRDTAAAIGISGVCAAFCWRIHRGEA